MITRLLWITLVFATLAIPQAPAPALGGGVPMAPFGGRFKVYESESIYRGTPLYAANCASCHGAAARGGKAVDLIRAHVTLRDTDGVQIGEYLKGAVHQNAVKLSLPNDQVRDIAAFLHSRIMLASGRGQVRVAEMLVGDAKAGEAYFNGAGRCNTCHSVTGDFKGIGGRLDAATLQGRVVLPPRTAGKGVPANAVKATVTPASGPAVKGDLIRVTDFDVVIRLADGSQRSWTRNRGIPKVDTVDPLQGHLDIMTTLKDTDMHNVTAYLAGVK